MEKQINQKIIEIAQQANRMIPVEWEELYVRFDVDKNLSGGANFFFKYQGKYYYFFDLIKDFGVAKTEFFEEYDQLFERAQELKQVFMDNHLAAWTAGLIHVDENNKLSVDFDYTPWLESDFGPSARTSFFQYKYLGKEPRDAKEAEQFKAMEDFQAKHNSK